MNDDSIAPDDTQPMIVEDLRLVARRLEQLATEIDQARNIITESGWENVQRSIDLSIKILTDARDSVFS